MDTEEANDKLRVSVPVPGEVDKRHSRGTGGPSGVRRWQVLLPTYELCHRLRVSGVGLRRAG